LAPAQQLAHLIGLQQTGDAEVVGLLVAAGRGGGAERSAVEDHLIEFGLGAKVFDLVVRLAGFVTALRG
jgi:hypothetical protein